MEGNAHLLQLIRKMRSQINKLERENRALKGELQGCGPRAVPAERGAARRDGDSAARSGDSGGDGAAAPPTSPAHPTSPASPAPPSTPASPRGRTAAAPEHGELTDAAMTVRRYPTVCPAPAPSSTRSHWAGRKALSNGHPEVPCSAQPPAPPAAAQLNREEEKGLGKSPSSCVSYSPSSGTELFQERLCKCRGKVKAVSFLLPVDMSSFAEKPAAHKSPQNQSTKHLMTIAEKDM